MMMGQQWLGKTKLKQPFRSTQNAFKKLPFKFYPEVRRYLNWLDTSDKKIEMRINKIPASAIIA